jgi:hypothetical protein
MDRSKINTLASKSGANYYTKHLDGYSHLVVMLYAVLSNLRSLHETTLGFADNATRMSHLGINRMICRSTLCDANKRRKSSLFGSCPLRQCHLLFFLKASIYLINIYTPFFSAAKVHIKYNNSKLNRKIKPKTFGTHNNGERNPSLVLSPLPF